MVGSTFFVGFVNLAVMQFDAYVIVPGGGPH